MGFRNADDRVKVPKIRTHNNENLLILYEDPS